MHGPPHTPSEIAAILARDVKRLESLGVDYDRAVEAVAAERGIAAERVAYFLDLYGHGRRIKAVVFS